MLRITSTKRQKEAREIRAICIEICDMNISHRKDADKVKECAREFIKWINIHILR